MSLAEWAEFGEVLTGFSTVVLTLATVVTVIYVARSFSSEKGEFKSYRRALSSLRDALNHTTRTIALAHYQQRYERVSQIERPELLNEIQALRAGPGRQKSSHERKKAEGFFERLWALHFEEWISFRGDAIAPSVYRLWLIERHEEFRESRHRTNDHRGPTLVDEEGGLEFDYVWGWRWWSSKHILDRDFVATIDALIESEITQTVWDAITSEHPAGRLDTMFHGQQWWKDRETARANP